MITLMGQDGASQPPDGEDLQNWADEFGLHHPVVADPYFGVTSRFTGPDPWVPTFHQLAPGAVVLQRDVWITEDEVVQALP